MSQDGNSSGPAPPITLSGPKYQLADYRYGREEMLALYDEQGVKFSDSILSLACDLDRSYAVFGRGSDTSVIYTYDRG